MNIGFDGKRAIFNNTGLGNYSRLIVDALSYYYPDNTYTLYTPKIRENVRLTSILERSNIRLQLPHDSISKAFSSIWRVAGMNSDLRHDNIDLFHGLSNELPLNITKSGIPSIVTIHDLIFLRYPEYYNPIDVKIYNYKFRKACENASRIIAISECTKRDIISQYHISPDKIDIVYQGCDDSFRKDVPATILSDIRLKYSLPQRFILYVGTIEQRKNLLLLIKALRNIDSEIHVVALGRKTKYFDEISAYIASNGLNERVHFYHDIPFSDLPKVYRLAELFVYPSRFEGFGIPMLEALCCGIPAIGAKGSSLEEAGGPDSIYIEPDDVEGLRNAINNVINDHTLRNTMITRGIEYSKQFTRDSIAHNIIKTYEKVL